jgi:hypothetical protein
MARLIQTHDGWVLRDDWTTDDVQSVAECMEIEITDGMAMEVLNYLADTYDLSTGLNWGLVEDAIQRLVDKENAK